ncbi:hypothetical protein A0H76_1360 [Hepatospora eriocheir]|uniref:5'-3' DNA helicase ZGRF1-like N-terminal domain-containing protein n=1 Tax=Hepatospora eriocheir TaxID=1081669 RepID=A0A1X0QLF8_9MICR|nr:hypothetical protein A0H76_1360 [Hepatospora eriocheir]
MECSFTKDKIKKRKKYLDGFISYKNDKIILKDENNKTILTTTSYKINEDDYIETSMYLIYLDKVNLLFNNSNDNLINNSNNNLINNSNLLFNNSNNNVINNSNNNIKRSNEEILKLFKN